MFPLLTARDVLRLASLDESTHVVDHLSVHRDIALAMIVKLNTNDYDDDHELLVSARCDSGTWHQVETIGDRETVDCQFGGGPLWMTGRELTYRIPGLVTLKTFVSRRGNWSFVYSDPDGRKVMGTSVVEGDWNP